MKLGWALFLFINSLFLLSAGGSAESSGIIVYNAASTTDVMSELAELYSHIEPIQVMLNPSSSGTLARQIEEGAPADLYLSANSKWTEYVGSLDSRYQSTPLLGNSLVWVTSEEGQSLDMQSAEPPQIKDYLSMGDPAHVPAGIYAAQALKSLGWYEKLKPFILAGSDVRAALSVVELGEAEWGIVYETDAKKSEKLTVAGVFPEESHDPIVYSLTLLSPENAAAAAYFHFLQSHEASLVFVKYGFTPLNL